MERVSEREELLTGLLSSVSRSFYLTLKVLPGEVRQQIGLAYLLARTSDTVADSAVAPVEERLRALEKFRGSIQGTVGGIDLRMFNSSNPAENILLGRTGEALDILQSFSQEDQELIRRVLDTIISGQELDLQRFGRASREDIHALQTEEELDDYTYRVAGCVGEFWTEMCARKLFPKRTALKGQLLERGVPFGKGLQLVNILRDIPGDLEQGRCYIPAADLRAIGLSPGDLLSSTAEPTFRPLYSRYLDRAEQFLREGWEYTNLVPFGRARMRLACAWPVLIGARTIARLRKTPVLGTVEKVKVSRPELRRVLAGTLFTYCFPGAWRGLFETARKGTNSS